MHKMTIEYNFIGHDIEMFKPFGHQMRSIFVPNLANSINKNQKGRKQTIIKASALLNFHQDP